MEFIVQEEDGALVTFQNVAVQNLECSEVAVVLPSTSAGVSAPASPATPVASRSHTPRSSGIYRILLSELNLDFYLIELT